MRKSHWLRSRGRVATIPRGSAQQREAIFGRTHTGRGARRTGPGGGPCLPDWDEWRLHRACNAHVQ